MKSIEYLTPAEVAKRFLVSPITVRQWADKGWLIAVTTPGGHRRFALDEVERFARERARPMAPGQAASRVLVVDDDVQLAGFLVELLESTFVGIESRVVHDGFAAGRQVQIFRPGLIVLDLMMPGVDGFQVCADLKTDPATRAIRVLAMTGYCTPENETRILAAGADACFCKPLDIPAFLAAIEKTLGT